MRTPELGTPNNHPNFRKLPISNTRSPGDIHGEERLKVEESDEAQREQTRLKKQMAEILLKIGALIIRLGFWGPLYYNFI